MSMPPQPPWSQPGPPPPPPPGRPPPPGTYGPPQRGPRGGGSVWKWILIGFAPVVIIGFGGCFAIAALVAVDESNRHKAQQRNAISDPDAKALRLGTPKTIVVRANGAPAKVFDRSRLQAGNDCVFYNLKGDAIGRQWEFCFARDGRLAAKYRWDGD